MRLSTNMPPDSSPPPPDAPSGALSPRPLPGLCPRLPLLARAPALAILGSKPTLVLFSGAATVNVNDFNQTQVIRRR